MTLLYSGIEDELRASVRDLLGDRAPWTSVLHRSESGERYDPALWQALARDVGLAGLAVAEAEGGHGASWREVAVVAEELGRSCAGTPYFGSTVLATALAQRLHTGAPAGDVSDSRPEGAPEGERAGQLLASLASGERTATVAVEFSRVPGAPFPDALRYDGDLLTGTVRSVADALWSASGPGAGTGADVLLVPAVGPDGPALFTVAAGESRRSEVVSLDLTRPLADVSLDGVPGELLASGAAATAALDAALQAGAVILAAEQLGLAQWCLDATVEYLKTRHQFGRPIGSFQALKHRAADLWAAVSQARAVSRYAADCLASGDADLPIAASLAQAYCAPAAVSAAEECVQLHGGIGFTWEHPAHLYLKRAKADAIALGTAAEHRARLGALVALPSA